MYTDKTFRASNFRKGEEGLRSRGRGAGRDKDAVWSGIPEGGGERLLGEPVGWAGGEGEGEGSRGGARR